MSESRSTKPNRMPARDELTARALSSRQRLLFEAQRYLPSAEDAEDVVQELFLMLSRYSGPMPQSPQAWFLQVVRRRALDSLRRQINRKITGDLEATPMPPRTSVTADVERALSRLKEPYRSAVRLRYLEGQSFAEMAQALESKERTARTWVARGLAALRKSLGGSQE